MWVYVCPKAPAWSTNVYSTSLCPFCLKPFDDHDTFIDRKGSITQRRIQRDVPEGLEQFTEDTIKAEAEEIEAYLDAMTEKDRKILENLMTEVDDEQA